MSTTNNDLPHYPGTELDAMSTAMNYHRWIVDSFRPYFGKSVAEVGAGIGTISQFLLETGLDRLVAFEPSPNMYPVLEKKLRHEQRAQAINDFFQPDGRLDSFDSVVYINVLEHIEDDRRELANALAALKPGGHLLVFVPALAWLYSEFDRQIGHYRRYTKAGLAQLARKLGYTDVRTRYFDVIGIVPWYVMFVLLRKHVGYNSVTLYDKLIVPPLRRIERVVPPPIGKSVLLIARKP